MEFFYCIMLEKKLGTASVGMPTNKNKYAAFIGLSKRQRAKVQFQLETGNGQQDSSGPQQDTFPQQKIETERQSDEMADRLSAGHFRFINERLAVATGQQAVRFFARHPTAFDHYHKAFRRQVAKWPQKPLDVILRAIRNMPGNVVVADMGCGEGILAEKLTGHKQVHSFDLVAVNSLVTACDMANVPLQARSVDVCVFCLSLMGTNVNDYLREANRILKLNGVLKIAEVASRFGSVKSFVHALSKMGFVLEAEKKLGTFFILFDFLKIGKVMQKRPLGLKLKPCLYKKR